MNGWLVLLGPLTLLLGAAGTYIAAVNGWLKIRYLKERDERQDEQRQEHEADELNNAVIQNALGLIDKLSARVRDQSTEIASIEQHQSQEIQSLREEVRLGKQRMRELEAQVTERDDEIALLKARIYDLEHPNRKSTRPVA